MPAAKSPEAIAELADEQAALRRVATLVAQDAAPAEIFAAVSAEVDRVFGLDPATFDVAVVGRFEPGPELVIVGISKSVDVGPLGSRWLPDDLFAPTHVHRTGRSARIRADDVLAAGGEVAEFLRHHGYLSQVASPIVVDGRLWGAMLVTTRNDLPPDTEERLERFTELVATAIANAESREAFAEIADEQAALRRVATLVAQGVPPAELFSAVTTEVAHVFSDVDPAVLATVIRFDPGPEGVLVGASRAYEDEPIGARWTPKDLYVSTRVLRTGSSARVDEADLDAIGGPDAEVLRHRGFLYQVGSPVIVEGQLWGAMTLNSGQELPPDTNERLESFTELVATAIANAESREAITRLADEQAALHRLATLVAQGAPPDALFRAVVDEVASVVGLPLVTLSHHHADHSFTVVAGTNSLGFPVGSHWLMDGPSLAATIHETGRAARIDDYSNLGGAVAAAVHHSSIRAAAGSPIVVDGKVWGHISVAAKDDEPLPARTEQRLLDFTELIATAIANAESRNAIARLADEQAGLRRVATLVARDAPSTEVFEAVAAEVGKLLDTDVTVVGRYDSDGAATAIGSWSSSPGGVPVGTRSVIGGRNVLTIVAETSKPARMDGYDDATGEAGEIARRFGWRSSIAAPIVVENRLWGVMLVATQRQEPFPAGAEERLAAFTDLVATAVANTEARHALERVATEQAALRRVATLVAQGTSPQDLFDAVAEEIGRLLPATNVSMARYEPDDSITSMASWSPVGPVFPPGVRWPIKGGTNVGWMVLQTGRPARIDDFSAATDPIGVVAREAGYKSAIGSPIVVEGHLWGAISAASTEGPMPPDSEARLTSFTELVATAVANAESREALAEVAEEQAALRRVATLVAQGASSQDLFDAVAEGVGRLLPAANVSMGRYESDDTVTSMASWSSDGPVFTPGVRWPIKGTNVAWMVLQTGRPARIDDFTVATDPIGVAVREAGYTSAVGSPIVVEGHLWGAISAASTEGPMPPDSEERLERFTELVATALANAKARAEVERLAEEQAALRRVATLVAQGAAPADVFAAVSAEVDRVFHLDPATFDVAVVVRFEPGPELEIVGISKSVDVVPIGSRWPSDDLFAPTHVLRTGRSARIRADDDGAATTEAADLVRRYGYVSQVGCPIVVKGRLWGAISVGSRNELPPDTEKRLERFTELVATAIANAESSAELDASRRRIVTASDDARRRIERDLHDGVQQQLVSLGLELGMMKADPPTGAALKEQLTSVTADVGSVLDALVELARGIHPAILSQGGLAAALRSLARRSAVPVELEARIDGPLPDDVEVATYYVAAEALTNVAKHARASVVHMDVTTDGQTLTLVVRDDGVGGADPDRGSGLVGLHDRVEALGGTIDIDSSAGRGTTVAVTLPIAGATDQGIQTVLGPPQELGSAASRD